MGTKKDSARSANGRGPEATAAGGARAKEAGRARAMAAGRAKQCRQEEHEQWRQEEQEQTTRLEHGKKVRFGGAVRGDESGEHRRAGSDEQICGGDYTKRKRE